MQVGSCLVVTKFLVFVTLLQICGSCSTTGKGHQRVLNCVHSPHRRHHYLLASALLPRTPRSVPSLPGLGQCFPGARMAAGGGGPHTIGCAHSTLNAAGHPSELPDLFSLPGQCCFLLVCSPLVRTEGDDLFVSSLATHERPGITLRPPLLWCPFLPADRQELPTQSPRQPVGAHERGKISQASNHLFPWLGGDLCLAENSEILSFCCGGSQHFSNHGLCSGTMFENSVPALKIRSMASGTVSTHVSHRSL